MTYIEPEEQLRHLLLPICWVIGHNRPEGEKPGWFVTKCIRCGRKFGDSYWFQRVPSKIAINLVRVANKLINEKEDQAWGFHGYGRIDNNKYIAKTHIESLIKQYKDDKLPPPSAYDIISEEGWIKIEDVGAEKFIGMINESIEKTANKMEREKTMKIMKGDLPREDE